MEVALFDAYKLSVTEHPGIKVSQRNFEMQRPKQEFKKLDELSIDNLHCSKKCMIDQVHCTAKTHNIKVNLFEQADYLHKGNKKKNIQLVKKNVTPKLFVVVLMEKLKGFAYHHVMLVIQITLLIKQLQACQIRQLSKFRTSQRTILAFFQRK